MLSCYTGLFKPSVTHSSVVFYEKAPVTNISENLTQVSGSAPEIDGDI